jgi:hypothetical protein
MHRLATFFAGTAWERLVPRDDLVSHGMCLAAVGREYVMYLSAGGSTTVAGLPGTFIAQWYDPRHGTFQPAPGGPSFTAPDGQDWVLYITQNN